MNMNSTFIIHETELIRPMFWCIICRFVNFIVDDEPKGAEVATRRSGFSNIIKVSKQSLSASVFLQSFKDLI